MNLTIPIPAFAGMTDTINMKHLFIAISALFILINLYFFFTDTTWYYPVFMILLGVIAYYYLRDRIEIHYQFKIFAVLMAILSLLVPLQILAHWNIITLSYPKLLIAESMALTLILLLRTHGWLKLPITFSIMSGMILLPYGIWGIIISIIVYAALSHTTVKGRLFNFIKVCGFAAVSLLITAILFYQQMVSTLNKGSKISVPTTESLHIIPISGTYGIIANIVFYLLLTTALFFAFKYGYIILRKTAETNPIDEIEHNNVLMILAILIITAIHIPFAVNALMQPVFWLSLPLLCGYYHRYIKG